ncbi:hypothetical protein VTJ04DRAFT_9100 [Mycothermus thermophilus]|uniref:uncharacterized protein n=1 Tax=Humicola insolens TaxID=85995 RepID=UPI003742E162
MPCLRRDFRFDPVSRLSVLPHPLTLTPTIFHLDTTTPVQFGQNHESRRTTTSLPIINVTTTHPIGREPTFLLPSFFAFCVTLPSTSKLGRPLSLFAEHANIDLRLASPSTARFSKLLSYLTSLTSPARGLIAVVIGPVAVDPASLSI